MIFSVIFALFVAAVAMIALGTQDSRYTTPRIELPKIENKNKKRKIYTYLAMIVPFTRVLLEKIGLDIKIKRRLDAAHIRLTATEFINLKIIIMIILPVAAKLAFGKIPVWGIFLSILIGFITPDIIIARKIAKRKYAIVRLLPETVDLWGLCVEAGLDFNTALKWVIEKVPNNPLIEEFNFVWEEIAWGKPRIQALKDMSKRLNIPEISSFVHTLAQSERMGTPVAEAFAILSEDTRLQRFRRGERIAIKAPLKILMPLVFCILPVIAIVVGGPILLQFMQGGFLKNLVP